MRIDYNKACPAHPARMLQFDTEEKVYVCGDGCILTDPDAVPVSVEPAAKVQELDSARIEEPAAAGNGSSGPHPLIVATPSPVVPKMPGAPAGLELAGVEGLALEFAPGAVRFLGAPDGLPVPGGDLLLVVRIPEQHAMTIKADAEVARVPVAEYFQRAVALGLDREWFRHAGV